MNIFVDDKNHYGMNLRPRKKIYSALFDSNEKNQFPTNFHKGKRALKPIKNKLSVPTLKSIKKKVSSIKSLKQSVKKELKKQITFSMNQITNKITKKSVYEELGDNSFDEKAFKCQKLKESHDNQSYYTPSKSSGPSIKQPRRSVRLQRVETEVNSVKVSINDLKKSRLSMRKVIKKQERSKHKTSENKSKKRTDPVECSSKINSPAKMSRLTTATTPRSVKILRGNRFSTPCKIIDSNNRTRVTRRSSRIYGLLTGITNPIAYQLNA